MMGNPDPWAYTMETPAGAPVSQRLAPALEVLPREAELSNAERCWQIMRDSAQSLRDGCAAAYRLRCVGQGLRGDLTGQRRVGQAVDATIAWVMHGRPGLLVIHMPATGDVRKAYNACDPVRLASELGRWLVAVCDAIAAGGVASEEV